MSPIFGRGGDGRNAGASSGSGKIRIGLAAVVAIIAMITYFSRQSINPITGQKQHVALTPEQEIALGLQAAPDMAAQFGGLASDSRGQARVDMIGKRLIEAGAGAKSPYQFDFHLLADPNTVNAFALPGGQVFITEGLYSRLETDGQLAGVLGHEVGHVLERHSAQQIAKAELTQGLTGAAVLATYDPNDPRTRNNAAIAALVGQLVTMRFGREDELQADQWGVRLNAKAGFDPRAMIRVMEILEQAAGGGRQPEFFSTHPNPEHRIERIREAIAREYPSGAPAGLQP